MAAVARFCRDLEAELGHPAQGNAYWTPRDSQGLPVHHDTHDVFVLQIAGEKRWLVYDPVLELPLKDQRYSESLGGPGEIVHDVTLRAGDTLYLPRGWLHQAVTSATDSLHLTVGVNVYTWIDALKAALHAAEDEVELRRSVPADGEGGAELVELLAARLEPEAVVRRMRRKFVGSRRPILENRISELRALDDLGPDTEVERRPTVIADLHDRRDGSIELAFEGKRIAFPAHTREEIEALVLGDGPVRPSGSPRRSRRGEPARARPPARARGVPAARGLTVRFGHGRGLTPDTARRDMAVGANAPAMRGSRFST